MRVGIRLAAGVGLALGLVAMSGAVFAQSPPEFNLGTLPDGPACSQCNSNFVLKNFTAQYVSTNTANKTITFDLKVTVEQTSFDGSDWNPSPNNNNSTEFHQFPPALYVELLNGNKVLQDNSFKDPFKATLQTKGAGITYPSPIENPGPVVITGRATYQLTLPDNLPPPKGGKYLVQIWETSNLQLPPSSNTSPKYLYTFRMGPPYWVGPGRAPSGYDQSWADDIVCKATSIDPPVGQLPEVPWAAGIPLLGAATFFVVWRRRNAM